MNISPWFKRTEDKLVTTSVTRNGLEWIKPHTKIIIFVASSIFGLTLSFALAVALVFANTNSCEESNSRSITSLEYKQGETSMKLNLSCDNGNNSSTQAQ